MGNKEQKVLILIHGSDDEDERKKDVQDTVEKLKNKDSHIIFNEKVDDQKSMIATDADPAYAQFLEMIMAAENQNSQQPEGCSLMHATPKNKFGKNDIRYSISPSSQSSSSDSSSSDEDAQLQQQAEPIKRGPHYGGSCLFDKHCIFANYMELTKVQCKCLNTTCKDSPDTPTKHYVYKMTESTAHHKKAKMEFGAEFTKKSLLKFIEKKPIEIDVCSATRSKTFKVTLKLKEGSNRAMLSAGWATAVKGFDMTPGQIYVFTFVSSTPTTLELIVALI